MSKKDNSVRNWSHYNASLIKRGDVTLWINVESWYSRQLTSKPGRPRSYSDSAIITMLILKSIYHLSLRSCQGFVESLFRLKGLDKQVPNYSSVCRRQGSVSLPKLPSRKEPIHLVIDSSGLKIFGEGEWKVRQHGYSKHRMWMKVHLGVDEKSQLIVSSVFTGNGCADDKKLVDVLDQYKGPLKQVTTDGAYDSHDCYETINARGAKAIIPPQPNPRHKPKLLENLRSPRDFTVYEIQEKGRTQWKEDNDYHRRSLAETAFYRFKQLMGGKISGRNFDSQKTEVMLKCHILNKMTLMNYPSHKAM